MTDWLIFMAIVGLVLLLPAKYDPVIRLKEWLEGWKKHD